MQWFGVCSKKSALNLQRKSVRGNLVGQKRGNHGLELIEVKHAISVVVMLVEYLNQLPLNVCAPPPVPRIRSFDQNKVTKLELSTCSREPTCQRWTLHRIQLDHHEAHSSLDERVANYCFTERPREAASHEV